MQGATWHKVEGHLKALRDMQRDQQIAGTGQAESIREYADTRLLMDTLQRGMAQQKKK